jgi:hypothetical protein
MLDTARATRSYMYDSPGLERDLERDLGLQCAEKDSKICCR